MLEPKNSTIYRKLGFWLVRSSWLQELAVYMLISLVLVNVPSMPMKWRAGIPDSDVIEVKMTTMLI